MKKLSEKARSTGDRRRLLNEHRPMPAPAGHLPLYVGEEQRRFIVPTSFLSHPLFKILLEMAYLEYGFDQESGLSVPCDVSVFEEVVGAIEGGRGMFDVRRLTGVVS
ncbi:hypothetical protein QJS04_geneDACA008522 [Acorus gramineus]|uniref:Small auxin up regulated protein n=1 Tax=Acorus gramineus TaxID=55184 RepID=A0AAV9AI24_ACOGR|nr:hypothetical protein QJS04_geneDACA008522 [Acorus gramineus]